ncbi:lytic transglycosylase domain-containing protein [Streptomyces spectabilis]|uniref:lytic transglycosylase domain-containing protein n=1 Tax=Streptomyces spectabilis TaxID=68270 RepID=UPI0033DACAE1
MLLAVVTACTAPLTGILSAGVLLTKAGDAEGESGTGWDAGGSAADIPATMLAAYKKASRLVVRHVPACRGMSWPVLAGIAKVESHHASGRAISKNGDIRPRILGVLLNGSGAGGNTTVFPDTDNGRWDGTAAGERAVGPFQFLPSTWASTGRDGNSDKERDPHNAFDAALGAAVYLCGRGRDLTKSSQLRAAIFQYNRSSTYVANVSGWISQYRAAASTAPGGPGLPKAFTALTGGTP